MIRVMNIATWVSDVAPVSFVIFAMISLGFTKWYTIVCDTTQFFVTCM